MSSPNRAGSSSSNTSASSSSPSQLVSEPTDTSAAIDSQIMSDRNEEHSVKDIILRESPFKYEHGHRLPEGWTCSYEPDTDEYKFEFNPNATSSAHEAPAREIATKTPTAHHQVQTSRRPTLDLFECHYGYHFPASPTSSMISELAKIVQKTASGQAPKPTVKQITYGKSKIILPRDEEEQAKRLNEMFPTATVPVIEQMIKIYHGREGLIKAALISLGYKRSTEYGTQQSTAQSPIMLMMSKPSSKKLFEKLVGYFPDKDETLIKNLMYKHKEVEHEIISALVESTVGDAETHLEIKPGLRMRLDKNGAIMKLRYLKFLYPSCDEIELYHLLHCHNLNAQRVMEVVEKRGHKRANIDQVLENRKSQAQQLRAQQASQASKDKFQPVNMAEAHQKRTKPAVPEHRAKNLMNSIKNTFQHLPDELIMNALISADYDEKVARKLIEQYQPIDESEYLRRFEYKRDISPPMKLFPSKGVQIGGTNFMALTLNESVAIPLEVVNCKHALALLKVDACTSTQDDLDVQRSSHAHGPKPGLAVGPVSKIFLPKVSLRKGPKPGIAAATHYKEICADKVHRPEPNSKARGRNESLAQGPNSTLRYGHNPKLIQRIHPFFETEETLRSRKILSRRDSNQNATVETECKSIVQ